MKKIGSGEHMYLNHLRHFLLGLIFLVSFSTNAVELTQNFNFQGYLVDTNSNVAITGTVNLMFEVLDPTSLCLIYQETQTVTADSEGFFSTKVGAGTRASVGIDGGALWRDLFQNNSSVVSRSNCSAGYTPSPYDGRKLRVTVNGVTLSPDFSMSAVPMATVAESLQGKQPSDFVPASGNGMINGSLKMITQSPVKFEDSTGSFSVSVRAPTTLGGNFTLTLPNTTGTTGQVLSTDGSGNLSWVANGGGGSGTVTNISSGTGLLGGPITTTGTLSVDVGTAANKIVQLNGSAQLPGVDGSLLTNVNSMYLQSRSVSASAPTNGDVLSWDGTAWTPTAAGGVGTVTNVAAGTGLTGGPITSSGTLSVDVGTTANKIVQLNGSAQYPAADGSLIANVDAMTIRNTLVSGTTPTVGQVLYYTSGQYIPTLLLGSDIYSSVSGPYFAAGACSTGNALNYNVVSDNLTCQAYSLTSGQVTTALGYTPAAAAIASLNGLSSTSQTFSIGATGTTPNWSSSTSTHTLNIPMASTGSVTAGLISNSEWTTFNSKLSSTGGTMTGNLNFSTVGSAASPIVSFSSSSGFYTPTANTIGFATNGAERMRLDTNGNLAIGNTTPTSTLDLNGAITVRGITTPATSGAVQGRIFYDSTSNRFMASENGSAYIPLVNQGAIVNGGNSFASPINVGTNDNYPINFRSNNVTVMSVTPMGKVGIGTNSPSTDLTIYNPSTYGGGVTVSTNGSGSTQMSVLNLETYNPSQMSFGSGGMKGWQFYANSDVYSGAPNEAGVVFYNGGSWHEAVKYQIGGATQANVFFTGQMVGSVGSNAGTTIDFNTGNTQTTTASCGAMNLNNLKLGGSYHLVVTGATSGTCTFTAAGVSTWKFKPANAATTASLHSVYHIFVAGTTAYVDWGSGY